MVSGFNVEEEIFALPLWLTSLLILLALAFAVWAGRKLNFVWRRRFGADEPDKAVQNFIMSASLGLLSLLLGFTFSMAVANFDKRRALVVEEANAVTTVYLLAQTYPEPSRSRLSNVLKAYVDTRLLLARGGDRGTRLRLLRRSEMLQTRIWASALVATRTSANPVGAIFLNNTQAAINVGSTREATRMGHHVPVRVSAFLVVYMLVTAIVLGFSTTSTKPLVMGCTLLLLLTLSTVLILDLDRPTEGAILESQAPMVRLQSRLTRAAPNDFQRLAAELEATSAEEAVPR
jgi:hypothetical protein